MFRPAASATTWKRSLPNASITRSELQPIDPVDPRMAMPRADINSGLSLRRIRSWRAVCLHQVDRFAVARVRRARHAPLAIVAITQIDARVGLAFFADGLQVKCRDSIAVG